MRYLVFLGASCGATFVLPVGCSSTAEGLLAASIAESCRINSDCKTPLVCAFERCHVECKESRDCSAGARCVPAGEVSVCQLEEDRRCSSTDDCSGDLVCGADGECRGQCATASECPDSQICVLATCADPDEMIAEDAGSDGTAPDASPDAGAPDSSTDAGSQCEQLDVNAQDGVFVVENGSGSIACGTRTLPCASIGAGIRRATELGLGLVYVAEGLYAESLNLVAGIDIIGGWTVSGSEWSPLCGLGFERAVIVQAPANETATVRAVDLSGSASLRRLTIESKMAGAEGESLYGVFATGLSTALTLEDVAILTRRAGDGADGSPGAPGLVGTGTCTAGDGASGGAGASVDTSDAGVDAGASLAVGFANIGFVPAGGATADAGSSGNSGTAGGPGDCMNNCFLRCETTPACAAVTGQVCAAAGEPGCGGGGGSPGQPGSGGGASIALFAWDARITLLGGSLTAGQGGNGGDGGDGGDGGSGALGVAGADTNCLGRTCGPPICAPGGIGMDPPIAGGAMGGNGGEGGPGGTSGGGAAGASCAYVEGGTAQVARTGTTLSHGSAGTPGSPAGGPGLAQDVCN